MPDRAGWYLHSLILQQIEGQAFGSHMSLITGGDHLLLNRRRCYVRLMPGCLGAISQIPFTGFLENIIHHTAVDPKYPSSVRLIASIRLEILQHGLTSCFWVDLSQDLVINTGSRTHTAPILWVV
jgi:hypothetical protein